MRARDRAHLGRGQQCRRLRLASSGHRPETCAAAEPTGEVAPGGGITHDPRDIPADTTARADFWLRARRRRGAGGAQGMLVARACGLSGWIGVCVPEGADPTTGSRNPAVRLALRSGRARTPPRAEQALALVSQRCARLARSPGVAQNPVFRGCRVRSERHGRRLGTSGLASEAPILADPDATLRTARVPYTLQMAMSGALPCVLSVSLHKVRLGLSSLDLGHRGGGA